MNKYQKAFNQALKGIREQGSICIDETGECVYYDNGRRCAVGHLMTDAAISKLNSRTNNNPSVIALIKEDYLPEFENKDEPFLRCLQNVHDSALDILDFEKNMELFAKTWNLKYED